MMILEKCHPQVTKAATPATVQATISPTNNINGDSNKGFIQYVYLCVAVRS